MYDFDWKIITMKFKSAESVFFGARVGGEDGEDEDSTKAASSVNGIDHHHVPSN